MDPHMPKVPGRNMGVGKKVNACAICRIAEKGLGVIGLPKGRCENDLCPMWMRGVHDRFDGVGTYQTGANSVTSTGLRTPNRYVEARPTAQALG